MFAADEVDVARVSGYERIGGLYEFEIDFVAKDPNGYDPEQLTCAVAALTFLEEGTPIRRIDGLVSRVDESLDDETHRPVYRLHLVPRSYLLRLIETQEVFLDLTVPQIIAKKLELCNLDYEQLLSREYPEREFVVQYRESDLAFISRLCEQDGISFYIVSQDGHDRLCFTDDNRFHRLADERSTVPFQPRGDRVNLYQLNRVAQMIPRIYAVGDYNYRTPLVDVSAASESSIGDGGGIVEFGGLIKTPAHAEEMAAIRREERECRRVVFRGKTDRADLAAGTLFRIGEHPLFEDSDLLVTEARHDLVQVAHGSSGGDRLYSNELVAVRTATVFRPERTTPRPRIHGVVSGIVLPKPGSDGTQPWLDEEGRYTVRILFDTADHDGKASHQVRQAQQHSGPGYGTHFPLRPGVEVLMAFIDGDVDRPVIIGSAPNTVTPSPVAAQEALHHRIQTASGIKIEFEDGF